MTDKIYEVTLMEKKESVSAVKPKKMKKKGFIAEIRKNWMLYLMIAPIIVYYLIFAYKPMYGALIAFQNYQPARGMLGSEWVGFKHFTDFFNNYYFWRVLKNTLTISISSIVFTFPAPIILALLMNEVRKNSFKRTVQTITYIPHFISTVVICGMIKSFTSDTGFITLFMEKLGFGRMSLLTNPDAFVPIYIISGLWQQMGWSSIIYMAALTGVSQELYEAAAIDGANRLRQTIHVTLPCIIPTIVTMLILKIGHVMSVGYEKIILLYNELTYETADVISSFIYRKGLQEMSWSFSAAVGIFNSVINFGLIIFSNNLSRKISETSLW